MLIQFSKYLIPYLAALPLILTFVIILFRLKSSGDLKISTFLTLAIAVWILGFILEIMNVTITGKIIFGSIRHLGLGSVNVMLFLLAVKMADLTKLIKKNIVIILFVVPVVITILFQTNGLHRLMMKNEVIQQNGILGVTSVKDYGIIFWIWTGYLVAMAFVSFVFLFLVLAGRHKFFRRQALILLFSLIFVCISESFYVFKIVPLSIDLSPFLLCFSVVIYWTLGYKYLKIGEVVPINYESIIENISDSVIVLNKKDTVTFLNKPAQDLFSAGSDYIGKHINSFLPYYVSDLCQNQSETKKDIIINTGGQEKHFEVCLSLVKKDQMEVAGKLLIMKDITDRKKYENKIKFISFHDYLTGLYNRAFFEEELARLNVERNLPLSIVLGDVNGLKMVNDTYGHKKGDELLKKVATILKQCFRKSDIVSRWGGDEFIILLPLTDYITAEEIADRIKKTCFESHNEDIPYSISLGISTKVNKDDNIEEIIKIAEDRMYENKMADEKRIHRSVISALEKSLDEKDYETKEHIKKMEELALLLGKNLKLPETNLNELVMLSALHDIGKIAVDDSIILKPGKLLPHEWEIVKKHPEVGYNIAKSSIDLTAIADAILSHHENWDGSGYPKGLKGTEIPLISRIISIVDTYDVMTNDRPFRKAFSIEETIKEIERNAGLKYDPNLVEVFLNIIDNSK